MRNLDDYFAKDHWTADRFATDFPEGVTWTVVALEELEQREGRRKVKKPVIWFRETDKYVFIRGPIYEALRPVLGTDPRDWIGARVTLRAIDGEGFNGEGFGIRVTGAEPPSREPPRKPRKLGDKAAARLSATLSELGSGIDELTAWLRQNEPAAFEAVAGREMPDWLDPAIPAIQRFTGEKRKAVAMGQMPPPAPAAAEAPWQEDDIPF